MPTPPAQIYKVLLSDMHYVWTLSAAKCSSMFDITRYSATGFLLREWGSQGSGSCQFETLGGLTVDSDGNLLVSMCTRGLETCLFRGRTCQLSSRLALHLQCAFPARSGHISAVGVGSGGGAPTYAWQRMLLSTFHACLPQAAAHSAARCAHAARLAGVRPNPESGQGEDASCVAHPVLWLTAPSAQSAVPSVLAR